MGSVAELTGERMEAGSGASGEGGAPWGKEAGPGKGQRGSGSGSFPLEES